MDPVRDCDDLLNRFLHSRLILFGHPAHIEFEIFRKAGIAGSGKRYGHDVTGVICPHGRLKIAVIALEIRQYSRFPGFRRPPGLPRLPSERRVRLKVTNRICVFRTTRQLAMLTVG